MLNNNNFNGNNFNYHNLKFSVIVAFDKKRGIGKNNSIPWNIASDLKYFKEITTKTEDPEKENAIIMGRKTWDSLPIKPLSGRKNIVISRSSQALPGGVLGASSIDGAILLASKLGVENIFIIGGASIYSVAVNMRGCEKIYATEILSCFECDTFFPIFLNRFEFESCDSAATENGIPYIFSVYKKIKRI